MAGQKTARSAEAHEGKHDISDVEVTLDSPNKDNPTESSIYSGEEEIDGDYGSYHDHVFKDPQIAEYWRNVYEKAEYEGRHRFDPNFTWSATEEKKLKRKVSKLYQFRQKKTMGICSNLPTQDRLENHDLVLDDVSRSRSQPEEHQSCYHGQHASRAWYEYERLQLWPDYLSAIIFGV